MARSSWRPIESYESAIGQESVAELSGSIALEGLAKIGFGCLEKRLRFSPAGDLSQLAAGESAQQVEPRELGMALQTAVQVGLGLARMCRPAIQLADRQQALSPEMLRLGFQGLVEMPLRLRQMAAFVLLEAAQEVVECAVGLDLLGGRSFVLGSLEIAGTLQAGRPLQMVCMSGPAREPRRAFQDPEGLAGLTRWGFAGQRLRDGFRQHHQHLVAAAGNLIPLLFAQ